MYLNRVLYLLLMYVLCSALYLANNALCVLQFRLAAEVHLRITIPTLFKHQQHLLQQVLPASTRFVPALQTYVVLDTTSLRWLWQLNKPAHLRPQMMPMIVIITLTLKCAQSF